MRKKNVRLLRRVTYFGTPCIRDVASSYRLEIFGEFPIPEYGLRDRRNVKKRASSRRAMTTMLLCSAQTSSPTAKACWSTTEDGRNGFVCEHTGTGSVRMAVMAFDGLTSGEEKGIGHLGHAALNISVLFFMNATTR